MASWKVHWKPSAEKDKLCAALVTSITKISPDRPPSATSREDGSYAVPIIYLKRKRLT